MKINDIADIINVTEKDPATSGIDIFVGLEHYDIAEPVIKRFGSTKMLSTAAKKFETGDVLIARRNVYLQRASIARFAGLTSGDSIVLRVKKDLDVKGTDYDNMCALIPFILNSINFWDYANTNADGTMSKRLSPAMLLDYEFTLPSLSEQKVLAEKLWAAYEVKQSYLKMIAATEEMVKSQFIEMFGDPTKNTKSLPSKKGEELFVFSSGKANTKSNLSKDFPYDCYGGNGTTGRSNQWLIDYPTIVIGRVGEYCGCVHKTTGKVWITDNAIYIKEYKERTFCEDFLFYLMIFLDFHRLADETGQPKITQRPLLMTDYIIPPMHLQEQFVAIAHQSDKSISELRKSVDAIDKVIKSLINENL